MATFIGFLLGTGLIALGITSGAVSPEVFWNWQGLAIVFGGTVAATLISYPLQQVLRGFASYFIIFRAGTPDYIRAINHMVSALRAYQRDGVQALIREVATVPGLWIFKDGVQMLANGYAQDETRLILEDQVRWQVAREHKQHDLFAAMAKIAPAFGMIGTLIGLINMLITLQSHPTQVGVGLAVALTTTFYGLILSNFIFAPIAAKIKEKADNNLLLETMQVEAIMMLYEKRNYVFVRDKLAAYINATTRKRVEGLLASAGGMQDERKHVKQAA